MNQMLRVGTILCSGIYIRAVRHKVVAPLNSWEAVKTSFTLDLSNLSELCIDMYPFQ